MDRVVPFSTERITNPYDSTNHNGIDLGYRADEEMNNVFANSYGEVVEVVTGQPHTPGSRSWGNYVLVKHNNGMYSRYCHLQDNICVSVGQIVDETTKLGVEGTSGDAEFRHLHFEVANYNLERIDPTPYLTESISVIEPIPEPTPIPVDYEEYLIQPGDTLSEIAEKFNTSVDTLCKINNIENPDLIYAGDTLLIPKNNTTYYVIQEGDTLSEIAVKFNTTVVNLCELNNIENPDLIYAGNSIRVK